MTEKRLSELRLHSDPPTHTCCGLGERSRGEAFDRHTVCEKDVMEIAAELRHRARRLRRPISRVRLGLHVSSVPLLNVRLPDERGGSLPPRGRHTAATIIGTACPASHGESRPLLVFHVQSSLSEDVLSSYARERCIICEEPARLSVFSHAADY